MLRFSFRSYAGIGGPVDGTLKQTAIRKEVGNKTVKQMFFFRSALLKIDSSWTALTILRPTQDNCGKID